MTEILIFGGTSEGREIADILSSKSYKITYCSATAIGEKMVEKNKKLTLHTGRMDEEEMVVFMDTRPFSYVIDATHPYADIVSKNIKNAAEKKGINYIRLLREKSETTYGFYAEDIKKACSLSEGNVLALTGSKQAAEYTALSDYKNRLFIRVLNSKNSVDQCLKAGIPKEHIIESFGVADVEENIKIIKKYNIKTVITKDSGKRGGFYEKREAAKQCGVKFIVIKRPYDEIGYSFEETVKFFSE